ncbi:unnamed protein product [Rotaria socialis]|uniref:Uncharacterized protein n=1 Tax=Rotaria socialis TaxID=392032 RepID=A0A821AKE6_9BILA|nr:unnamed protein product [Rotaria socialis]
MQIIHLSYEINLLKIHYSSFYQQSGSRYKHDHNYWLNYDFVMKTPKRRRLSSAYSDSIDSQLIFQSPCTYSSPKCGKTN